MSDDIPGHLSQAIFKTYGRMEPATAGRVAELLGFDPELVVPQLQNELKRSPSRKGSSSPIPVIEES